MFPLGSAFLSWRVQDRALTCASIKIAPLKLRHLGGAAGAFGEWLFSFITVFAGGIALANVGWKIWLWMLLSCAAAVPFVYFLCPEVCRAPPLLTLVGK